MAARGRMHPHEIVDGNGTIQGISGSPGVAVQADLGHGRRFTMGQTGSTLTKNDRLGQAAQNGNKAKVKKLLKEGISPDVRGPNGATALGVTIEFNHVDIAKLLLDAKATVNVQCMGGVAPLHLACQFEHLDSMKLLLERKANVEVRAESWPTPPADASPLDIAARHNRLKAVEMLLAHGASVNHRSQHGVSPLMCAVRNKSVEVTSLLIDSLADPTYETDDGTTCLSLVAKFPSPCKELIESALGIEPAPALPEEASGGSGSASTDESASLPPATSRGKAPMAESTPRAAPLLTPPPSRRSPPLPLPPPPMTLFEAAREGVLEALEARLPGGAHTLDEDGLTALHHAVDAEQREVVLRLLKAKADPNALDGSLSSPLHYAALLGSAELAALLVEAGASITLLDDHGKSPAALAMAEGHRELAATLQPEAHTVDSANAMVAPITV